MEPLELATFPAWNAHLFAAGLAILVVGVVTLAISNLRRTQSGVVSVGEALGALGTAIGVAVLAVAMPLLHLSNPHRVNAATVAEAAEAGWELEVTGTVQLAAGSSDRVAAFDFVADVAGTPANCTAFNTAASFTVTCEGVEVPNRA